MAEGDTSTITPCECDPNSSNPCGPDSDCLNRYKIIFINFFFGKYSNIKIYNYF